MRCDETELQNAAGNLVFERTWNVCDECQDLRKLCDFQLHFPMRACTAHCPWRQWESAKRERADTFPLNLKAILIK